MVYWKSYWPFLCVQKLDMKCHLAFAANSVMVRSQLRDRRQPPSPPAPILGKKKRRNHRRKKRRQGKQNTPPPPKIAEGLDPLLVVMHALGKHVQFIYLWEILIMILFDINSSLIPNWYPVNTQSRFWQIYNWYSSDYWCIDSSPLNGSRVFDWHINHDIIDVTSVNCQLHWNPSNSNLDNLNSPANSNWVSIPLDLTQLFSHFYSVNSNSDYSKTPLTQTEFCFPLSKFNPITQISCSYN